MSSTHRGGKRGDSDFYETPRWAVHRLLEKLDLPTGRWLEPCAGDGAIIRAVTDVIDKDLLGWTAIEIRPECCDRLDELFLARSLTGGIGIQDFFGVGEVRYDVCITNPPFSLAMDFIRKARSMCNHSIFLLRLNFLGSEERSDFIRQTKPDLYILPNRPSFRAPTAEGARQEWGTDSIEYAWFHWWEGSTGKYVMLDSTPVHERR